MSVIAPLAHASALTVRGRVTALLPEIAARAAEIEAGCTVPLDLLDKLQQTGAFRMCLPACFGGEELRISDACAVVEDVASADASVAWHLMVAAGSQVITARLPRATLEEFYATGPDTWPKAALAPKGIAVPVEGGYRLSGRWPLASGARKFDWVSVGFLVKDENGVRQGPDGKHPDMKFCLLPKESARVIETWDATGLRGTRSDDLEVKDAFVPEQWQASLFGPSTVNAPSLATRMPIATGPHHCAVVLGILKGAISDLAATALVRRPAFNPMLLMKDDPVFRSRFGEIAVRADALRALYVSCINTMEECGREGRDVTRLEGARLTAAVALIHHEANSLMDQIMMLSGAGAVYSSNPQQRRWRDLRCAAQHQAANIGSYGEYAAALIECPQDRANESQVSNSQPLKKASPQH